MNRAKGQWTGKLRQLILENPTLPLLIFASKNANMGNHNYECCTDVYPKISEYLNYIYDNGETCYLSKEEFKEDLYEKFLERYEDLGEKECEELVEKELAEYESCWRRGIIVQVGN